MLAIGEVEGPPKDSTLPSSLQDAIDYDTIPDAGVPLDRTVVVHRTFGATRQVEALRDHLLHLFNERRDGSAVFVITGRCGAHQRRRSFAPLAVCVRW